MSRPKLHQPKPHRSLVLLLLGLMLAFTASAQDSAAGEKPDIKTVIKQTRYIEPSDLLDVLRLFEVETAVKPEFDAMILRGTQDNLDVALRVIESLDNPSQASASIELNVYILAASNEPVADSNLPSNLHKVVEQLDNLFDYRGFKWLETVFLRTRENGRAGVDGGLSTGSEGLARYALGFDQVRKPGRHPEDPSILRFKNFAFEYHQGERKASIVTDLEIPVGRMVVLGKATPDGLSQALILVAEARVANDWGDLDTGTR